MQAGLIRALSPQPSRAQVGAWIVGLAGGLNRREGYTMTYGDFKQAYLECALWADGPHDATADEIEPSALAEIEQDCADFYAVHSERIGNRDKQAGHDFYLTRNRHGAGFWDGDWSDEDGKVLTAAARVYGTHQPFDEHEGNGTIAFHS